MSREKRTGMHDMQKSLKTKIGVKDEFKMEEKTSNEAKFRRSIMPSVTPSRCVKKPPNFLNDDPYNPKLTLLSRRNRVPYIGPCSDTLKSCSQITKACSETPLVNTGAIPKKRVTPAGNQESMLSRSKFLANRGKPYETSLDKEQDKIVEETEKLLCKSRKTILMCQEVLKQLLLPTFEEVIRNPDFVDPPEIEAQLKKILFTFIREYEIDLKEVNEIIRRATGHGFHSKTVKSRKFLSILLKDLYLRDATFGEYDPDGFYERCEDGESDEEDWRVALDFE